jgi:hypothetical protein
VETAPADRGGLLIAYVLHVPCRFRQTLTSLTRQDWLPLIQVDVALHLRHLAVPAGSSHRSPIRGGPASGCWRVRWPPPWRLPGRGASDSTSSPAPLAASSTTVCTHCSRCFVERFMLAGALCASSFLAHESGRWNGRSCSPVGGSRVRGARSRAAGVAVGARQNRNTLAGRSADILSAPWAGVPPSVRLLAGGRAAAQSGSPGSFWSAGSRYLCMSLT